jgi:hypothetical protein
MARIVVGGYMVRYPLGGMLSMSLQWLLGLRALGHDVHAVEKSAWPGSCFDPVRGVMSDDFEYGFRVVNDLLTRFGLERRLCYVDAEDRYHGLSRAEIEDVIRTADVFIDHGSHGAWHDEASHAGVHVLVDGEPGWRQMAMEKRLSEGEDLPEYDVYFTMGLNLGSAECPVPLAGREWLPVLPVVASDEFGSHAPPSAQAAVTTVMNWQAHDEIAYEGRRYGQKDLEFPKFIDLPRHVRAPLELAVAGAAPRADLEAAGWSLRDAHAVTIAFDGYWDYIRASLAEFSVCKNVFVDTNSGWFSDRSAAYLSSGRPVVLQDTGFGTHLPTGEGLFAVRDVDEAAAAIEAIRSDYSRHSRAAREIAREHLDARKVLDGLLDRAGAADRRHTAGV